MRFASEPPYSSVRWFASGDRNSWIRNPCAPWISTTSKPAACARAAALPQASATRADLLARERARRGRALVRGQRAGRDQFPRVPVVDPRSCRIGARQRPAAFPGALDARLAPRVAELDARRRAALMHEIDDARELRHEGIVPDAQVAHRAAAAALDLGRFEDHQPRAARRVASRVHQMPVGGESPSPRNTGAWARPPRGS